MRVSAALRRVLEVAIRRARERRQPFCGAEQALEVTLAELGHVSAASAATELLDSRPGLPFDPPSAELSRVLAGRVLELAGEIASRGGRVEIGPEDFLAALLAPSSPVDSTLRERVVSLMTTSATETQASSVSSPVLSGDGPPLPEGLRRMEPQPSDDDLVARDELVEAIARTLLHGHPLVVGPVGSGRRSLVRLLLRLQGSDRCPPALRRVRLFELDPVALVAGTAYRGDFEKRMQAVVAAIENENGDRPAVLVAPEAHLLVGSTGDAIDAAGFLAPVLRRRAIGFVGCTTPDLLRERIEERPSFASSLTVVSMPTTEASEAARLLSSLPAVLSRDFDVKSGEDVAVLAAELCARHVPHVSLPGAAVAVARAAAATLAFEAAMLEVDPERRHNSYWTLLEGDATGGDPRVVGERHLAHALSQLHRIPFDHLVAGVDIRLASLSAALRSQVFGQDHALDVLARCVKVVLANLAHPDRPRARLFFTGPPGTGKSESARVLAAHLMGGADALLRFDMSEFQEASAVSTLIGSDKGLVGSEEGGRLTEPLRIDPRRVVLFDEIEKAHPSVFNLFLQILEYGEIHDKKGRRVSFRHALCIFTSNSGCGPAQDLFGLKRDGILRRLAGSFRPEFLDRIDEFVPFRSLDYAARQSVVDLQLRRLRTQVASAHGVDLQWSREIEETASQVPPGEAGARNILRWIEAEVKPAIADALLKSAIEGRVGSRLRLDPSPDGGMTALLEVPAC